MGHIRRHTVRIGSVLLVIALAASVIAGCSSSGKHNSDSSTLIIPKDPGPVTVVAGKATTLDLGGGADLIIPPGAMTPGATVRATYQGRPGGNWTNIAPTFAPVELISNPPNAIHGLLTLEFPVPVDKITPGVDPAVQFGISTYHPTTNTWTPFDSTYDAARHMVVAQIPHFSWWNPFTWDFDALFARVAQDFGQLVGARAGQATCSGGPPAWVGSLAGVINDADVAIRSCAQAQKNILDVEMVNNRPYGQVLTYGSSVKWGWHQDADSPSDTARNQFMDVFMTSNELYLPPLGQASVGIFEPKAGTNSIFHIGPTKLSIGTDLFFYLLGKATDNLPKFDKSVPKFGECVSFATQASLSNWSVSGLRDDLVDLAGCVEQAFTVLVATGALDKVAISKLATLFGRIKSASLLAQGIALAGGVTWKIGDLVADWIVNHGSMLGNGFSVYAKTVSQPVTTPVQPPQPQPQPLDAYSNYGPANAGHAMCRGNPGNSLSMPGGTVSQTFTVPTGVASLSSALVQIDPDPSVTAHLSVAVNGNIAATADAAAAGDTRFVFGPVSVSAGDAIKLTISFTATYGKIITVYTAGNPGGTFTASNSCPDGAPNVSTTSTGLRAVVSGMS
jgi:hypothetical protein